MFFLRMLWKNDNSLPTAILLFINIYYVSGNELLKNPYKLHKGLLINDPAQEKIWNDLKILNFRSMTEVGKYVSL